MKSAVNITKEINVLSSDIEGTKALIENLIKQNKEKIKIRERLQIEFKMHTKKSGRIGAKHKDIY